MKPSEAVALGRAFEEQARRNGTAGVKLRDLVAPRLGMTPSRYAHAKAVVCAAEGDPCPTVKAAAEDAMAFMDRTGAVETAYRQLRAAREKESARVTEHAAGAAYEAMGVRQRRLHDRRTEVARLHGLGYSNVQIAEKLSVSAATIHADVSALGLGRGRGRSSATTSEAVRRAVVELRGMTAVLEGVVLDDLNPDADEAARWKGDLDRSLKALRRIQTHLKDRSQQ